MSLVDISKLSGASRLLKKFPHLAHAKADSIFNAIYKQPYTSDDDGNFILRSRDSAFREVNIDDGRHSVQRIDNKNGVFIKQEYKLHSDGMFTKNIETNV